MIGIRAAAHQVRALAQARDDDDDDEKLLISPNTSGMSQAQMPQC
jgi:hypothetical protein